MAGGQPWLQELRLAEAHLHAGRLADAETVLRQILTAEPNQPDALNALAALALDAGKLAIAIALQQRALAVRPNAPLYWANLGEMQRRAGDPVNAMESCKKAVRLRPSFAAAHGALGAAQADAGDFAAALRSYDTALSLRSDLADVHNNRGNALRALGRVQEAEAALARAIALRPDLAEAHNNMGDVLRGAGRFAEAEASYRRALAIKPAEAGLMFNLSLALEEQGRTEEARALVEAAMDAARRMLASAPDNAGAANVLGLACVALRRQEEAVEAFKLATAKPGHVEAWVNLGNTLRELGRADEALAAFERAHDLAPRAGAPLLGLAQAKAFKSESDRRLTALEAAARDASLPASERLQAHFALGKAYDDLGRADDAFAQMRAGNVLRRQDLSYDEARALGLFERIKSTFDSDIVAHRRAESKDATPIFVIGMPRSGTTLVEQIIASHPLVGAAGEISALNDAVRTLGGFPESVRDASEESLARVGEHYVGRLRSYAPDKAHITDKAPSNFYLIGLIALALPQAKIVHVTRDPVDTCLSCYSKLFTRGQDYSYDLAELGRYYRAYNDLMRHWRDVLPEGRILEVRYEDVVGDIESQARRLLAYCALDWDERALAFHQNERAVSTASASQVRQPIYARSVARWRQYEAHLQPLLEALGDLVVAT